MAAEDYPNPAALRLLPSVHSVLEHGDVRPLVELLGRRAVVDLVRGGLEAARQRLENGHGTLDRESLLTDVARQVAADAGVRASSRIGPVVNATGVILHTGLGRSQLSESATQAVVEMARAGNLEVDLESGQRRHRGYQLQAAWETLTGAEDVLVVNNNAAATLLVLQVLCAGREVIISRGQLIEIGGSFRLPEIFELGGVRLREVGTTNRTRPEDYEAAITPQTAAIMRVHPSNYRIVGFSESPGVGPLAELAHAHGLFMIDDVGSGCLLDVRNYGLPEEPTFTDSISAGADLVLGSGDKLLGGPQAGIILGKAALVKQVRRHPLARTIRVDKLTLAALSATLDIYLRGTAESEIPTLSLLAASVESLKTRASNIKQQLSDVAGLQINVAEERALVGGGSLPGVDLPTAVLHVVSRELSSEQLSRRLRIGRMRVMPRIQNDRLLIDLRSVQPSDDRKIVEALREV